MPKFNDAEIDSILASVDQALAKAAVLAKNAPMERPPTSGQLPGQATAGGAPKTPSGASMAQSPDSMKKPIAAEAPKSSGNVSMAQKPDPMKKDSMDPNKKPEDGAGGPPADAGAAPAAPTDDAPAMGAADGGAPGADAGAPPPADDAGSGAGLGPQGEGGLEGEQGGDAPLSDDELHEIYASMDPAELERHFMIIRSLLQGAYGDAGQGAAPPAEAGAPPAPTEAPPAAGPFGKSEDSARLTNLEQENATLRKSLEKVVSAMEVAFTPTRKAVTDIAFIRKSENDAGGAGEVKELSKAELTEILTEKSKSPSLTKGDREAINDFILRGGSKETVLEIVKRGK